MAQGFKSGDDVTDLMNAAPVAAPHPEAKIGAPSPDAPVTLGDIRADPVAALKRVGAILGKDATDPKLWMGIAASYFGPKLFNAAAPVVARAASGVASGAIKVAPEIIKHGSTAAGAYVGGPAGAVIGRTVGESLAERMGPKPIITPEPTGPVSTAGYPRLTVLEPSVATAPPPVQPSAPTTPPVAPPQATPAHAFNTPRLVPSPQKLANDLGIAAKRAGVIVTAADDVAVLQAVRGGADPAAAVADVIAAKPRPAPVVEPVIETPPVSPDAEFAAKYNLPSDDQMRFGPNKNGLPSDPPKADLKAKINAARARTKQPAVETYESRAVHVTTPESAASIRAQGFDVARGKGLGGDDYGPGVYLADEARDMGSYWRNQFETKNETGIVATEGMGGSVTLKKPFKYEPKRYSGTGRVIGDVTPEQALQSKRPDLLPQYIAEVESGVTPRKALGSTLRKSGYDGIVIEHTAGDEIVAFDAASVKFDHPATARTAP